MALTAQQRETVRHPLRWLFNREPEQPGEIPRRELASYSLGLMGQNHLYNMVGGNWFFQFCVQVLGIDEVRVGKMCSALMAFDAVNDPVIGAVIDNHRFRDGRKLLPWIKLTAPIIGVLSFLLFFNWNLPGEKERVLYCVLMYVPWSVCYTFHDASIWGMTAAISTQSSQRARAAQWSEIGVFLGGLLPGLMLPMLQDGGAFGLRQQQVYMLFALVLCLGGGFQSLFTLNTTERVHSLPSEEKSVFHNLGALRYNHVLLLFLASELLRHFAPYLHELNIYQQMSYHIGGKTIPATALVTIFSSITGLPGVAAKFFATKIAKRVGGMKRVVLITCVTGIFARVVQYFIGIKTLPRLVLVYLINMVHSLPDGINGIAVRAMISDSVEYVEWRTGERTEGVTMSVRNLMSKMGTAVQRLVQGICLHFLQYDKKLVELKKPQNAHFQKWAWPVYRLGPALELALALLPLLFIRYPDSLKNQVESEMAQRRQAAGEAEAALHDPARAGEPITK